MLRIATVLILSLISFLLSGCQLSGETGPGPSGERVSNFTLESPFLCTARPNAVAYRFSYQGSLVSWRTYWQADDGNRYDLRSLTASVTKEGNTVLVTAQIPSFETLAAKEETAPLASQRLPENAYLVLEATFASGFRQTRASYSILIFDC
ncbi:MAG: hypothetical protein K6T35_07210 [Meiothermus silvanus]|nr:hypothetical protein [Allomeiothermus silvanus]